MVLALLLSACGPGEPPVTVDSLLAEWLDRDRITRWPRPPYRVHGTSSTDPRFGFAADDRGHFLGSFEVGGRVEHLLVDEQGPGALVRLWSANPERAGTLRVYLDGAEDPVIEAPMHSLLSGDGPVPRPLAAVRGGGGVLLVPIPYARSCRVTVDRSTGKGVYFTAQVRRYAPATRVRTASRAELSSPTVARAAAAIAAPTPPLGEERSQSADLESGQSLFLDLPPGPAVVRRLSVRAAAGAAVELVLQFDDGPASTMPLLAVFGDASAPFATWWMARREDGTVVLNLPMPYASSARIELRALDPASLTVRHRVDAGPLAPGTLRLRGSTRHEEVRTRPRRDFAFARLDGPGVLVADTLTVHNPARGWWGSGDPKIRLDGAETPAIFGTGTEDYYGAAWCNHEVFSAALTAQPRADAPAGDDACSNAAGTSVLTRGRALDALVFPRQLDFDLGVAHREDAKIELTAAVWWYDDEGDGP